MQFKQALTIMVLLLGLLINPEISAKESFNYVTYTLENGLQVFILPNPRAPVVYHTLWYKVGSADSPHNKSGLAHFLEHLMFKGTTRFPADSYQRLLNNHGGTQGADTTWDRTRYFATVAKEHLPIVMELEADRMQNLAPTSDIVESERGVVLQERNMRIDSVPSSRLDEAANAAFFWQHPYGQPAIGYEEHIRAYTLEDAQQFYQTWYVPNNAILVIAGDVNVEALKPLIAKYYGGIKSRPLPVRERKGEPTHRSSVTKVEVRDTQIGVGFERIYRAPNRRSASLKQEATLYLLQDILGDQTFGRLTQALVDGAKMASVARASYTGHYIDPYSFVVMATPVNPSDLLLLEASVEAEIRRLIVEGISDSELKNAKEQWLLATRYRKDSLHGLADYFGENLSVGYTMKEIEEWLDLIQSITKEEIQTSAKDILSHPPDVIAYAQHVAQN